ncbi:MAG: hypothetical protein V6Z89_15990 [Desulfobacter sp.]
MNPMPAHTRPCPRTITAARLAWLIILLSAPALFFLPPAIAQSLRQIEKDLDGDGRPDQMLFYDNRGTLVKTETDADHDGFAERRRLYSAGRLDRVLRDTDQDRILDCTDIIENGKRIRQERTNPSGILAQVALFDTGEQIRHIKKDTTGDHLFDTHYHYEKGELTLSTRDTNASGRPNIRTRFAGNLPLTRTIDADEDGTIEQHLFFDNQGRLEKQMQKPGGNGVYTHIAFFENNRINMLHQDLNADTAPDIVTIYENDQPQHQEKDSNFDGRFDITTRFSKGLPAYRETDRDFDGTPDFFAEFDAQGLYAVTREDMKNTGNIDRIRYYEHGQPVKIDIDQDTNGVFESRTLLEQGRIIRTRQDKNQDGRMDMDTFFNEKQEKERLESDTEYDGKPDLWQFYKNNTLETLHRDENRDGRVDVIGFYKNGDVRRVEKDTDGDGYFETIQQYDHPDWTLVVSRDADGNQSPDSITYYTGTVVRKREYDRTGDGAWNDTEYYTADGRLQKLVEHLSDPSRLIWFYEDGDAPVRGEEDRDGDGRAEIWYIYEKGRLAKVEEDTNGDGKPDLWEAYDGSQKLVERKKDLDFDGIPDFTDPAGNGTEQDLPSTPEISGTFGAVGS